MTEDDAGRVIIVGAGPVGLGAALVGRWWRPTGPRV